MEYEEVDIGAVVVCSWSTIKCGGEGFIIGDVLESGEFL